MWFFLGIFVFLFVFLFIFASRSGWVLGICGIFGSRFGKFILYSRRLVWVVPFGLLMIFSSTLTPHPLHVSGLW